MKKYDSKAIYNMYWILLGSTGKFLYDKQKLDEISKVEIQNTQKECSVYEDIFKMEDIFSKNRIVDDGCVKTTHRLFASEICDCRNKRDCIGRIKALNYIHKCAHEAIPNKYGTKMISIYYTGHSSKEGKWIYPQDPISLEDILN